MVEFLHNHPWLANIAVAVLGWLSAITLNQMLGVVTIALGLANLFFTIRDKWWRDPVRKAKRAAKARRKAVRK